MAEEEIRESERKYRELYETIKDGILATDLEGNILEVNKAFLSTLELSAAGIRDKNILDITPKKWRKMTVEITNQVKARGYSDEYEIGFTKKNGTVSYISVRGWLKKDREGNPAGMWVIVRDITERKKAEEELKESEEKFKSLIENAPIPIFFIDFKGNILAGNKKAAELAGYPRGALVGKNLLKIGILPKRYIFKGTKLLLEAKARLSKKPFLATTDILRRIETFEFTRKDGKKVIIELMAMGIKGKHGVEIMCIIRDITRYEKLEEELKRTMGELRKQRTKLKSS